jgi:amino acid adenylation domain-containing protein
MSDPHGSITSLPVEQQAIRTKCFHPTGTFVEFKKEEIEQSIPERFEKQVRNYAHRLAVSTGNQTLTYEALNDAANRVARTVLRRCGEGDAPVALVFEKGAPMVVAILGALKAGKSYVLLEPSFPVERTKLILEHSQAALLVTHTEHFSLANTLNREVRRIVNLDELDSSVSTNVSLPISPDAVAWVHYTSGSTGEPKGVVQTHRNALHVVMTHTNDYHICPNDRLTFLASRGGDIFLALLNGASVFPMDVKREGPTQFADWLMRAEITVYGSVMSTFRHLVTNLTGDEKFPHLRLIKLIGEPIYKSDVELYRKHFSQRCILVNRLGGTETGTFCHYFIDDSSPFMDDPVPVGYSVGGKEVLLLDDDGNALRTNPIGEIAVKSRYLSPGYWQRPDLTAAAFRPDPQEGAKRIYHSGDLGCLLPDGCLVHLGRKDFQVKIRGHRVETAEVEMVSLALNQVKEAVVIGEKESSGTMRLVAYVVPSAGSPPTVSELRRALSREIAGLYDPIGLRHDGRLTAHGDRQSGPPRAPGTGQCATGSGRSLRSSTNPD